MVLTSVDFEKVFCVLNEFCYKCILGHISRNHYWLDNPSTIGTKKFETRYLCKGKCHGRPSVSEK